MTTSTTLVQPAIKQKSIGTFAVLALVLGALGVHWFYLGRPGKGLLYLALCVVGLSWFLGIFDAIRAGTIVREAAVMDAYGE